MKRAAALLFMLSASALAGEEIARPDAALIPGVDGDISVDDWRSIATGRTLTYEIDGAFFALERYHSGGSGVMLQLADGSCMSGVWDHFGQSYCYYWEDAAPVCFRHVRAGGRVFILQLENGVETGDVQEMTRISDAPLICEGLIG